MGLDFILDFFNGSDCKKTCFIELQNHKSMRKKHDFNPIFQVRMTLCNLFIVTEKMGKLEMLQIKYQSQNTLNKWKNQWNKSVQTKQIQTRHPKFHQNSKYRRQPSSFFSSICNTVRTFDPYLQNTAKLRIFKIVLQLELQQL